MTRAPAQDTAPAAPAQPCLPFRALIAADLRDLDQGPPPAPGRRPLLLLPAAGEAPPAAADPAGAAAPAP